MKRPSYSSHPSLDDLRHWEFSRSSGLPRDYFERSHADLYVLIVCVLALVIALGVAL